MRRLTVWAPDARTVALVIGGEDVPMLRQSGGWWATEIGDATGGVDRDADGDIEYGFRVDDRDVRPDPRSRRQPDGVHGRSRTFDAARYRWSDGAWTGRQLAGSAIYELHVGTFTPGGTLDTAVERLDHVVDLGVHFVELLPVNDFNGTWNWGYDGVLWFAVHEAYGGPAAYQRFVDECHGRGLGVIQDVVYNHLGASGNYLPEFGPYLRADASNTWGSAVNLDADGSDEVRRYILDNARMWFTDFHVDGLRLDAVHALADSRAQPLLEEMAIEIDTLAPHLGRPLSLIAESDLNDPRLYTSREAGGAGLTAAWDDDVHHAIHAAVTGEAAGYYADFVPLSALAKVLTRGYLHDGTFSSFRGRRHGRPIALDVTPAWRLVASIQNHDQVGNRATGDRMNQQAGARAQEVAAVLLLTAPFTPMLFMGEEWAASTPWQFFTSHPQADLGERTRQGRFEEFARHGWDTASVPDPQDPATFERSRLDWSELDVPEHAQMLRLYRDLLRLRRSRPSLTDPRFASVAVDYDQSARWIVVRRGVSGGERTLVAVNLARQPQAVSLGGCAGLGKPRILLATDDGAHLDGGETSVVLPALSAAVIGA